MATINLGAIKFNWKGAYNSSTTYAVDDVVSSGGNSYVCIQAHSNQAVGNATAYWNIMSSAGTNGTNGTNGTDVGTVITTQGDILYRDGSGLQRLPKGTAGQVLQMNSGATAPEYGTVSSDFVKIASGTHTSANYMNIDNCFTADYNIYKLYVYDITTSGNSAYMRSSLRSGGASGSTSTASEYRYVTDMWYRNSSGRNNTGEHGWNDSSFRYGWNGTPSNGTKPQTLEHFINNPYSNTTKWMMTGVHGHLRDEDVGFATFAMTNDSTASIRWTGMSFWTNNITAWSGKYAVYGMKT